MCARWWAVVVNLTYLRVCDVRFRLCRSLFLCLFSQAPTPPFAPSLSHVISLSLSLSVSLSLQFRYLSFPVSLLYCASILQVHQTEQAPRAVPTAGL